MLYKNLLNEVAVASSSEAMEADTIQHERSSKSGMGMKKLCLFGILCLMPFFVKAQDWIVSAGTGVGYGGLGIKIMSLDDLGFSGSVGYSNGMPFNLVLPMDEGAQPLNKSTLNGLAFTAGLNYWANCNVYMGFHLVGLGHSKIDGYKHYLYGFNWTVLGGIVRLGDNLAFDFGVNFGVAGGGLSSDDGGELCMFLGLNIGIGIPFFK